MAVKFIPVLLPEFCQPDETMLFGRRLVQITKELKIALPSITGTPIMAFPEDRRYRIKVHIPGRTFGSLSVPVDFRFTAPTWILGRNIAVHTALGRIQEEYRAELVGPDHAMISRRTADGEIIRTIDDDSVHSYVQDLEAHIRTLEIQMRRSLKTDQKMHLREIDLEDATREAHYEHEEEIKDFMDRLKERDNYIATLQEKMDLGEELFPSGDDGPLVSNDQDYEESSTEGSRKRRRRTRGHRIGERRTRGRKDN